MLRSTLVPLFLCFVGAGVPEQPARPLNVVAHTVPSAVQDDPKAKEQPKEQPKEALKETKTPPPISDPKNPNILPGIKLPAPFEVSYDEQFVTIKAECTGEVEWLVLGSEGRIKNKINRATNETEVGVPVSGAFATPPRDVVIRVYAIGVVDGKMTGHVWTEITVRSAAPAPPQPTPTPPQPQPTPPVDPPIANSSYHVTVIEDPLRRSPEYVSLTRWLDTRAKLIAAGHKPHQMSTNDPLYLDPKSGFAEEVKRVGLPALIIQDKDANLVRAVACPKTAEEILKLLGGK